MTGPGPRQLPPAVLVHRVDCPEIAGRNLPRLPTEQIARLHPNGRQHPCYHFTLNAIGVVETVQYPPHAYQESSVGAETHPGISRNLCRVCGSTTCADTYERLTAMGLALPPPGARMVPPPPLQER